MAKKTALIFLLSAGLLISMRGFAEDQKKYPLIVPLQFKTVKEAIESAKPGDTILVKAGTYEEKDGFRLTSDLKITGEGPGKTKLKVGKPGIVIASSRRDLKNITIKDLALELSQQPVRLGGVDGFLLQNCVITSRSILECVKVSASKNVEILNCTFANSKIGISVVYGPVELTVRNSIFYKNGTGIQVLPMAVITDTRSWPKGEVERLQQMPRKDVSLILAYNDFWSSTDCLNCKKGEHDITKNPDFMDPKKQDFRLSSDSPCVDAGDPDEKYNDPDGSRNDIGAFPFKEKK